MARIAPSRENIARGKIPRPLAQGSLGLEQGGRGAVTIQHKPLPDYFVVVTKERRVWRWEIQRRPMPLGIKLYEDGFKTEFAARLAGEKALQKLLAAIAEERRLKSVL